MFGFLKNLFGPGVDFQELVNNGAKIIDVRTPAEYKQGHVKGSVNIPLDKVTSQADKIKKMNVPIITCCASGMRSGTAASVLKNRGIDAHNGGSWTSMRKYAK